MKNEIQIFNNPAFGDVRTTGTADNPMFCASDICRALGYTNGRKAIADHCDEGDVTKRDTPTSSGVQCMTFVNESGLYSMIFGSKLETAKQSLARLCPLPAGAHGKHQQWCFSSFYQEFEN